MYDPTEWIIPCDKCGSDGGAFATMRAGDDPAFPAGAHFCPPCLYDWSMNRQPSLA